MSPEVREAAVTALCAMNRKDRMAILTAMAALVGAKTGDKLRPDLAGKTIADLRPDLGAGQ